MLITTTLINAGLSTLISNGAIAASIPTSMFEGVNLETAILDQMCFENRLLAQLESPERIAKQAARIETLEILLEQYQITIDLNADYNADELG